MLATNRSTSILRLCGPATIKTNVMFCIIWYHLQDLKNVKNTHGGVLLLVIKVTLLHGSFSRFLDCTNGTNRAKHHISFDRKKMIDIHNILEHRDESR